MTDEIEIIPAVAGQKNKASTYNENFNRMKNYVIDSVTDLQTDVRGTLSLYQNVNTLATSGTIALTDNSVNTIIPQGAVTFTLPTIASEEANKFHQILVQLKLTDTSYVTASNNKLGTSKYFDLAIPAFDLTGNYNLIYEYDNIEGEWFVGVIIKGA